MKKDEIKKIKKSFNDNYLRFFNLAKNKKVVRGYSNLKDQILRKDNKKMQYGTYNPKILKRINKDSDKNIRKKNTYLESRLQNAKGKRNIFQEKARILKEKGIKLKNTKESKLKAGDNKKNNKEKKGIIKKILKYLLYIFSAGFIISFLILLYWFSSLEIPSLSELDNKRLAQSTKIYDRTGEYLLYDFHGDERRTNEKIENVSQNLINATVAVEDKDFYDHNGFKLKSTVSAVYQNVVAGQKVRGGSTITQQVIKNYLLTREKTYDRKAKEIVLALKLEKIKSKQEILEMYLNQIPYGGQIYGIQEASKIYFGKPAADLTIVESAYLAGIPQAPSIYSPYISGNGNRERLEERKNIILNLMLEQSYITQKEWDDAKSSKVTFLPLGESSSMRAPHFTNYVIERLKEIYTEEELFLSGFKVYTTLDWEMHKELEEALSSESDRFAKYKASNSAAVALDNRTGEILSMLGSIDFYSKEIDGQTNVTIKRRQPGSTMKPFAYAELISQGFSPEAIIWDVPTQFNVNCSLDDKNKGSCYMPLNYGGVGNVNGPVSLRKSLIMSLNIPAVKVIYLAGLKEVYSLSNRLGLNLEKDYNHYGLSLVLGSAEVRLLDLTAAYGVFGNNGKKNGIISIKKIIDMDNEEVYSMEEPANEQVIDQNVAKVMNDMLTSHSQSANVYYSNKKVAVKTGTTNDYKDVWTVGYSKKVSLGLWAGNNDNKVMTANSSSTIAAPVWKRLMNVVNVYYTPETFAKPIYKYAVKNKTMLNGEWKVSQSTEIEEQEIEYITAHTILHYIDKANIKKSSPNSPALNDNAYSNWENAVQTWLSNNGYNIENIEIPEEDVLEEISEDREELEVENDNINNEISENVDGENISVEGNEDSDEENIIVTHSNLDNLEMSDAIDIKVKLDGGNINKVSYYVNSKRVLGSSPQITFDLSTFLGLKNSNTIAIKVVSTRGNIHEYNTIFTMQNL